MHNYLIVISYDGTSYLGWQKTPYGPSIEETLEKALHTILQHPISLNAASRTDKGVHALGQAVSFLSEKPIDENSFLRRLRKLLPPDIRARKMLPVPRNFHPTLQAISKCYTYQIWLGPILPPMLRNYFWHYPYPLDLKTLFSLAPTLIGKWDFSSFTPTCTKNPICHLSDCQITSLGTQGLLFTITGDRFAYHMIRIVVGTLIQIAAKKISLTPQEILTKKNRSAAGITAPAEGLTLIKVSYDFPI